MIKRRQSILLITGVFLVFGLRNVRADTVHVAVAANFTDTARELAQVFRKNTGHEAVLSFGASGQFYAQIREGAPFEVFLSADDSRPKKLVDDNFGIADEEFSYAVGKLVLWSRKSGLSLNEETLKKGDFSKIAIANPLAAPYGAAALQVMETMGVATALQPRWVLGENIAQTFQFVASGNAQLGFVALSQVMEGGRMAQGSAWRVPTSLHAPIRQDAALLLAGRDNAATIALLRYLRSDKARKIMHDHGYDT